MLPQGTCEDTKLNLLFQPGGEDDNSWSRSQELKLPSDEDTARDYHRMVNVLNAAPISAPHSLQPPAEIYKSLGNLAMGVFSRTGPRPDDMTEKACRHMRSRSNMPDDESARCFQDIRVSYATACLGREWQLRISLPLNLWFAQKYRTAVRFVVVVYNKHTKDAAELLQFMFDNFSHFISNGLLTIATAERDSWHASVCKNSAHVLACVTPWPGKPVADGVPWLWCAGDRHVIVNLDADNILTEEAIGTLGHHLRNLGPGYAPPSIEVGCCLACRCARPLAMG